MKFRFKFPPPPALLSALLLFTASAASAQGPGHWVFDPVKSSVTGTVTETTHGVSNSVTPNGNYGNVLLDVTNAFGPYVASASISGSLTYTAIFNWFDEYGGPGAYPPPKSYFLLNADANAGSDF